MSSQLLSVLLRKNLQKLNPILFSKYSQDTSIPLPGNVKDINAIETARFSPQRNRDITSDMIATQSFTELHAASYDTAPDEDDNNHFVDSYDCTGTVSLNSAMQTNVPQPFTTRQKAPVHLNMPGGEWSRSDKYIAEDMQNALFSNKSEEHRGYNTDTGKGIYTFKVMQPHGLQWWNGFQKRLFSTSPEQGEKKDEAPGTRQSAKRVEIPGLVPDPSKLSSLDKLKRAIAQYGSTVLVFHTSISLLSLGACYLAVTSGLDLTWLNSYLPAEIPEEVGGFVIAYAIHKAFAPARISITLICSPIIVSYLRRKGILKAPKTKVDQYFKKPPVPYKAN